MKKVVGISIFTLALGLAVSACNEKGPGPQGKHLPPPVYIVPSALGGSWEMTALFCNDAAVDLDNTFVSTPTLDIHAITGKATVKYSSSYFNALAPHDWVYNASIQLDYSIAGDSSSIEMKAGPKKGAVVVEAENAASVGDELKNYSKVLSGLVDSESLNYAYTLSSDKTELTLESANDFTVCYDSFSKATFKSRVVYKKK